MTAPAAGAGWRDPWAWLCALVAVPLLLASLGAPIGEPFADDYDFLHHAFLSGDGRWLDGGGGGFYWRPLARQFYYRTLGGTMLAHPVWIALLQSALIGLAALLLYRALRVRWPAPWAATAATFPFLIESARMLLAWPSNLQDLGAVLFAVAALHEASRRRLPTALAALLASLLCKELAVIVAPLLPWMPPVRREESRVRWRWTIATLALVAAWGACYAYVLNSARLSLARELFQDPEVLTTPWLVRYGWAVARTLGDAFSLDALSPLTRGAVLVAIAVMIAGLVATAALSPPARTRLRAQRAWIVWGLVWFAGATALHAEVYPEWRSYRSAFALTGLGIAAAPLLGALHPAWLGAVLVVRLAALGVSPGPRGTIADNPEATAASINTSEMERLQRLVRETRITLLDAHPRVPAGARIARHLLPHLSIYAFGEHKALQCWYRDSTVRWMPFGDFLEDRDADVVTLVEFQPPGGRQVVLVRPDAMRSLLSASDSLERGRWNAGLRLLARAESLQTEHDARVFFGLCAGERARALGGLGRLDLAEREALRSLSLWPANTDPRFSLAYLWASRGELQAAAAQLDTLLRYTPRDTSALLLMRQVQEARAAQRDSGVAPR